MRYGLKALTNKEKKNLQLIRKNTYFFSPLIFVIILKKKKNV